MIESRSLVVRPCRPFATQCSPPESQGLAPGPRASIFDADTMQLVGHVYHRLPEPRWRRWFMPARLAIHEAGDEPLVFTAQRAWVLTRTWEVCDADGHVLGVYRPARRKSHLWVSVGGFTGAAEGVILDQLGQMRGLQVRSSAAEAEGTFLEPAGMALAQIAFGQGQTTLAFAPCVDADPILKMLLLAAVLVHGGV